VSSGDYGKETWVIETSSTAPAIEWVMFVVGAGEGSPEEIIGRISTQKRGGTINSAI